MLRHGVGFVTSTGFSFVDLVCFNASLIESAYNLLKSSLAVLVACLSLF